MDEKVEYLDAIRAAKALKDNGNYKKVIAFLKQISGYDVPLSANSDMELAINEGARRLFLKLDKLTKVSDKEMDSLENNRNKKLNK